MRKEKTNRAVPLDAVPERRTQRCSPRFRPGDRFCELSFRYLSPGIEGEKCRPLDHMWQIPFIHSTRSITSSNFYIYNVGFQIFPPCGILKCVLVQCVFDNCVCAFAKTPISRISALIQLSSMRFGLVHTHKIDGIYACAFTEETKSPEKQRGKEKRRLAKSERNTR